MTQDNDNHYCPQHGVALKKNRWFDKNDIWVCPKLKCGYKENEEGVML